MARSTTAMKKKSYTRYSEAYRHEALTLVDRLGVTATARELGIHASQLYQYSVITLIVAWLVSQLAMPIAWPISVKLLSYFGSILIAISFIQFTASFYIDSRYDKEIFRCVYWSIWYPFAYWVLNMATVVIAFPKAIMRQKGRPATWTSPDRGEQFNEQ